MLLSCLSCVVSKHYMTALTTGTYCKCFESRLWCTELAFVPQSRRLERSGAHEVSAYEWTFYASCQGSSPGSVFPRRSREIGSCKADKERERTDDYEPFCSATTNSIGKPIVCSPVCPLEDPLYPTLPLARSRAVRSAMIDAQPR